MEELKRLKIWSIDKGADAKVTALGTAAETESEGLLEDILTRNPDMLAEGLIPVGRQTRTAGGPLDLMGVAADGRLTVFELKRGTLSRDAVAQVIDYASHLEDMGTESLYRKLAEESGTLGTQKIDEEWYRENFPDDASLTPLRMVLVGLGVDEPTERMVNYLARSGVDISLLTFHGFEQDGKTLFARQVEVDSSNAPVVSTPRKRGPQQFWESIRSHGVDERLVDEVSSMFMRQTVSVSTTHSRSKRNFLLDYSWFKPEDDSWSPKKHAATFFIETYPEGIKVGFCAVAVAWASPEEFDRLEAECIKFERRPKQTYMQVGQFDEEYMVSLSSLEEWHEIKAQLTALVERVCEEYTAAKQKALSEDIG